jgi:hypothetical protein
MKTPPLQIDDAPKLSAEAAVQCLDFLYALTTAFENHYVSELLQAQRSGPQKLDSAISASLVQAASLAADS